MREAPALAGATRPRPRSATPAKRKAAPGTGAPSATLLRRAFARPGVTVAGAAFAALMTGIVVNAVVFQKGHRPAPLLSQSQPVAPAVPSQPPVRADVAPQPVAPPPPPAALATPVAAPAPVQPGPAARPAVAPKAAPKAATAHAPKAVPRAHKDAIGDLIGTLGSGGHGHDAAKAPAGAKPVQAAAGKPRPHLAKDAAPPHD